MSVKDKLLLELYEWALRYALVKKNNLVEVEDAVQEMVLAVVNLKWRNMKYAKQVMRNRLTDLFNHNLKSKSVYLEDEGDTQVLSIFSDEDGRMNAKDMVLYLKSRLSLRKNIVIDRMLEGHTVKEIVKKEGISRMSIHRYLKESKTILTPVYHTLYE